MAKIAVAGATGLIGKKLVAKLLERNDEVIAIGRDIEKLKLVFPDVKLYSDYSLNYLSILENTHSFINLAGANVASGRWTKEYKKKILDSRLTSTKALIHIIEYLKIKPKSYITASAIGYYGYSETKTFTEEDSPGNDFLANVCQLWESEAFTVSKKGVREVAIRIGIVLAKDGGALKKMLLPFYFFVGGPLGDGTQWFSWIHIDDLINTFLFAIDNNNINGPVNATAPNPVRMKHFTNLLGKVLKRPDFFMVPEFLLKLIMGEAHYIVTKGSRVIPTKLLNNGFVFKFALLEQALDDLLNKN
jgi:hypothetical protein